MKRLILSFIFISLIIGVSGIVLAGECENAGYKCYDTGCPDGTERINNITCPSDIDGRPNICCKEVIDMNRETKITLDKEEYQEGDYFEAKIQFPYSSDCSYYFINPSKQEAYEGGGECGINTGFSNGDIGIRLGELFSNIEYGTYKLKVISKKSGYTDIVREKEFRFVKSAPNEVISCSVEKGEGTCNFLDKLYQIKHKGCGYQIDLDISYDGKTESFQSLKSMGEVTLKNDVKIKISGAPCAVYQITLSFKKDIDIFEDGTYNVKENTYIKMNEVYALIREISSTTVYIKGNNAQVCDLKVGEECKIYYGPVSQPHSKNLKIVVHSIDNGIASITVTKILEVIKIEPTESQPIEIRQTYNEETKKEKGIKVIEFPERDIPKDKLNQETIVLCSGCELDKKCYPFGFRKDKNYCDDKTSTFINQNVPDTACENSFECDSNLCIDNKCVSGSLWAKFMRWFNRLFGGK